MRNTEKHRVFQLVRSETFHVLLPRNIDTFMKTTIGQKCIVGLTDRFIEMDREASIMKMF